MSELITARIRAHATQLGLPGIAEDPAALAARAEQASLGYLDFLDLILGEEAGLKDSRRCRAALHASGLPHHKTLQEFDFAFQPTLDDMIRKLRAADAAGDLGRQLRGYLRSSILIIDEVGYLPLNRHDANLVFQIIARRYEKGSVIITSNKTFSEWGQVFTDDVLATAILDRFLHHCEVITINGPSWRMKDKNLTTDTSQPMP